MSMNHCRYKQLNIQTTTYPYSWLAKLCRFINMMNNNNHTSLYCFVHAYNVSLMPFSPTQSTAITRMTPKRVVRSNVVLSVDKLHNPRKETSSAEFISDLTSEFIQRVEIVWNFNVKHISTILILIAIVISDIMTWSINLSRSCVYSILNTYKGDTINI